MSGRERDKGRKYQSGSAKRKKVVLLENEQKKLPKITGWVKSTPLDEVNEIPLEPGENKDEASIDSEASIKVSNEASSSEPVTSVSTSVAVSTNEPIASSSTSVTVGGNVSDSTLEKNQTVKLTYENDIGLWPEHLSEDFRSYWIEKGSAKCRNYVGSDFKNSAVKDGEKTRYCSRSLFTRKHTLSGEDIDLGWLCYSEKTGCVFCFTCRLMSQTKSKFTSGFKDWKHAREAIESHSNSEMHKYSLTSLAIRKSKRGQVNEELVRQYQSEHYYWSEVLQRCVDVLIFICERGLPLRGDNEDIGSPHNGNYLGILELLSKYDPFLATHIKKHANQGSGHVNYLSSTICEELIEVLGKHVMCTIVQEVQKAKYYSISVDSTPDISHVDQLCLTIRYVLPEGPVERFLTFVPLLNHTGKGIADLVLSFLESKNISISDCRGQSYDNASNMSGKYKGTQAYIRTKCEFADFVPCMAHSLNLVGVCAAECCRDAVNLFGIIQRLYVYLSKSTYRWQKHRQALQEKPVVKCLSDTRWSARADAVEALSKGYEQSMNVLENLMNDDNLNGEAKCEASGIMKELDKLETVILLVTWEDILTRFNVTSQKLQTSGLDFNTAVKLLGSLKDFVHDLRDRFDEYEKIAVEKCGHSEYEGEQRRIRRRKRQYDESDSAEDAHLQPREQFRAMAYLPIIDQLATALDDRLKAYEKLGKRFGFMSHITTMETEELRKSASNLVRTYPRDLESCLVSEMVHFQAFLHKIDSETTSLISPTSECNMYSILHECDVVSAFPNVELAFRIYLSMFVTNCTGERSFSKLKRIKSSMRSTMNQNRLASLTLLSAECEILKRIDTAEVIQDFARMKARRKVF